MGKKMVRSKSTKSDAMKVPPKSSKSGKHDGSAQLSPRSNASHGRTSGRNTHGNRRRSSVESAEQPKRKSEKHRRKSTGSQKSHKESAPLPATTKSKSGPKRQAAVTK